MKVSTIQRRWVYIIGATAVVAFSLAFVTSMRGAEPSLHQRLPMHSWTPGP